jgi:hypothetical protein
MLKIELFDFNNESHLKVNAKVQNIENKTVLLANISGNLSDIDFPKISHPPKREYGLWTTGCLEIFVSGKGASYTEYNFGFNQNYEMFTLTDYREYQDPPKITITPKITIDIKDGLFTQRVELPKNIISDNPFSITAAIKLKNGSALYFANKHCGEKADFHLEGARVLRMPGGF